MKQDVEDLLQRFRDELGSALGSNLEQVLFLVLAPVAMKNRIPIWTCWSYCGMRAEVREIRFIGLHTNSCGIMNSNR